MPRALSDRLPLLRWSRWPRRPAIALAALALAACGAAAASDPGGQSPGVPDPSGGPQDGGGNSIDPAGSSSGTVSTGPSDAAASPKDASTASDAASPDGAKNAPDGAALPPMKMPDFIVGYNEAWFASNFGTGLTTNFNPAYVNQVLDGVVANGGHVVRIFLFELHQGFVLNPALTPQTQSLSPALLANVDQVLTAARARGLWVYLTALEGNEIAKVPDTKAYYTALLNDTNGEGQAYQERILAPLLQVLDRHKDNVFGFDLMNEIEAPKNGNFWSDNVNGPRGFMQRTTAFIKSKSPWLRVTSTAGWDGAQYDISLGLFSGLGLDFYDLHVYSDDGTYSGATAVCDKAKADGVPVYLGEFGQKKQQIDDALQVKVTSSFLNTAKSLCFKGALAWRFDADEKWWAYALPGGGVRPATTVMKAFGGP